MLSYLLFKISEADLKTFEIPDRYTAFIAAAGLIFALQESFPGGHGGLAGLASRIIMAETILIVSGLIMGFGDAKLFAALALLLGHRVISVFVSSLFLSGLYCTFLVLSKKLRMSDRIAFAPFIAVSAFPVYIMHFYSPSAAPLQHLSYKLCSYLL